MPISTEQHVARAGGFVQKIKPALRALYNKVLAQGDDPAEHALVVTTDENCTTHANSFAFKRSELSHLFAQAPALQDKGRRGFMVVVVVSGDLATVIEEPVGQRDDEWGTS